MGWLLAGPLKDSNLDVYTGLDVNNFLAARTPVPHPGLPYLGCMVRVVMLQGPLVICPRSEK